MTEKKAIYYGQIKLIPGILCDGYVLDDVDSKAVMSERGMSDLLGMDHAALIRVVTKGVPKTLKPFIDKDFSVVTESVEVIANNSSHKGRSIVVCSVQTVENLIFAYALALAHRALQENQRHIGERCVILLKSFVRTALESAIKEACGLPPKIQETAQKHYVNAVAILEESQFRCSLPNKIATKKDICKFLKIPEPTLSSFLRKHSERIQSIKLDVATIKFLGSKAKRMNGYPMEEVTKIVLGMDTAVGVDIKQKALGKMGDFFCPYPQEETNWERLFQEVFEGFGLKRHYSVGQYTVDFFISDFGLCLECNGFEHKYYLKEYEAERQEYILTKYALVRFPHKIKLEKLFHGILQARKAGDLVDLCALEKKGHAKSL